MTPTLHYSGSSQTGDFRKKREGESCPLKMGELEHMIANLNNQSKKQQKQLPRTILQKQVFVKKVLLDIQICEPPTYEMRVITIYSDSATAVSPAGPTMVGAKGAENVWLF